VADWFLLRYLPVPFWRISPGKDEEQEIIIVGTKSMIGFRRDKPPRSQGSLTILDSNWQDLTPSSSIPPHFT
jgi:hypothetical protein